MRILLQPRPPDQGLYDHQLVHMMNLIRSRVTFLERKVINVIDLLVLFDEYSRATDPLNSYLVELDVGELSLLEAKQYLRKALTIQKQLEKAWKYYHADHGIRRHHPKPHDHQPVEPQLRA